MAHRLSSGIDRSPPPRLTPRVVWSLLVETVFEWSEDRAPRLGATLAFYTVFALAPGLIVIIALAALLLGQEAAQGQIINQVQDLIGFAGAQAIQAAIESARSAGGSLVATSLGALTLLFGVIYKLLPDVMITWQDVWVGAAVTALLFTIGKSLIGLYLGRSTVASVYGAAGSLIVILLWIYYSAQVVFFGAEFTKVYSRRFGAVVVADKLAVPLTAEARTAQGMDRSKRARAT